MESFKEYLLEWGFFKKKAPQPQPQTAAKPASNPAPAPKTGFTSRNPKDHPRNYARDFLVSEYEKHNNISEKHHTDETRKRRDALEAEVVRRGGKARMRPEWHDAYKDRPKPVGTIHWTNEKGEKRRGY
jgi:hypothetical protein